MKVDEVRKRYLAFFERRGHAVIPSASLVPENDPTTLFTGSGMQPLLPYLLGEPHPKGKRLVNSQKCFRAEDIEEVGDNRHTTFFEMLGNWSLGDYFKEEQLAWCLEFLTKEIGIPQERLWMTCFAGDESLNLPKDTESAEIWKRLGIPEERILFYGSAKNWWSRVGVPENMPAGEPGGPDAEVFYEFSAVPHDPKFGAECHPNCDCGRFLEICNNVFMQYIKNPDGKFALLPKQNVDFGAGLERVTMAALDNPDIFPVNHAAIVTLLERLSGKSYSQASDADVRAFRIIADHIKAAVFMLDAGVRPSNTERGYIVRRLLRRAVRYVDRLGMPHGQLSQLVRAVVGQYRDVYNLGRSQADIEREIGQEEERFRKTLAKGLREFEKLAEGGVSGKEAFVLFSTYGFPLELTQELALERGVSVDTEVFEREMVKHQAESRAGAEQKFKGGLADVGEKTVMLHTATHLLLAGLRKFLGDHVHQAGSNITAERTRFDFTHPEKVRREILDKVEAYVNEAIHKGCTVRIVQLPKEKARQSGVEGSFWERYPDTVNVYEIAAPDGMVYSRELCGGPHVENTGAITGTFKITKEEALSAGVRRVKATLTT